MGISVDLIQLTNTPLRPPQDVLLPRVALLKTTLTEPHGLPSTTEKILAEEAPAAPAVPSVASGDGGRIPRDPADLKAALRALHTKTVEWDTGEAKVFLLPVDVRIAPNYYQVIESPMDLSTVGQRIEEEIYRSAWQYLDDMELMINNCLAYNKSSSFHHKYALRLKAWWMAEAEQLMVTTLAHHGYCCGQHRKLSGVTYRCRGGTCFIRYGGQYWFHDIGEGEHIIFCHTHYQKLGPDITMPRYGNGSGDEVSFQKAAMIRAKNNNPLVDEKFVECADCGWQAHEICEIYNAYLGQPYICKFCLLVRSPEAQPKVFRAQDIPLSDLALALQEEIKEVSLEGARITMRTVNHTKELCEVKPILKERYPDLQDYPYTKKVIMPFIEIDGVDCAFYGVIVHEYGEDCAEPNHRRVYISLLDSVRLPTDILPSTTRTALYHAILRGYLRYAGRRGFRQAHIYTCPPRKGQNYIFPHKPLEQKEISVTRLRSWYADMLNSSMYRPNAAILSTMSLPEAFPDAGLLDLPYFDGDNWPDLIEDLIKIDDKEREDEAKKVLLRHRIDEIQQAAWLSNCSFPEHRKPIDYGGFLESVADPARPRKKRRIKETKQRLSLDRRIALILESSKRDFIVVNLMGVPEAFVSDPDAHGDLATSGDEHTIASFFQAEKLEFGTLRHVKFSSALLLFLLISSDKSFDSRWPEGDMPVDDRCSPNSPLPDESKAEMDIKVE